MYLKVPIFPKKGSENPSPPPRNLGGGRQNFYQGLCPRTPAPDVVINSPKGRRPLGLGLESFPPLEKIDDRPCCDVLSSVYVHVHRVTRYTEKHIANIFVY